MGDPEKAGRPHPALQLWTLPLRLQPRCGGGAVAPVSAVGWIPGFCSQRHADRIEMKLSLPTPPCVAAKWRFAAKARGVLGSERHEGMEIGERSRFTPTILS